MLDAVDPLLYRIEALPEHGCYLASFVLGNGQQCGLTLRVEGDEVIMSQQTTVAGWAETSDSFRAVLAAVQALDYARERVGTGGGLRDVPGGWDVRVGNVVLSAAGQPNCVAHGDMERIRPASYRCEICGALAQLGDPADRGLADATDADATDADGADAEAEAELTMAP
jgi:hypothetical protein